MMMVSNRRVDSATVMARKGQMSFFIIAGILILFAAGIFLYIVFQDKDGSEDLIDHIQSVPTEFSPVADFVTQCLHDVTAEGFQKLGFHGGYINPYAVSVTYNDFAPTESAGLRFFPGDDNTIVPYWYYFESSNDCTSGCRCDSEKPPLHAQNGHNSIELQVKAYIEQNLKNCIREFRAFRNIGYDISAGLPEAEVMIRDNDIAVILDYPVDIRRGDTSSSVNRFYSEISLNFKRIYELAEQISADAQKHQFLEKWTIELMEAASFSNTTPFPPTFRTTFDPGAPTQYWTKSDTRSKIQNYILTPNIPMFQLSGTDNYNQRHGLYQKTTLPISTPSNYSLNGLNIDFQYFPLWPVYYDISGRGVDGEIIGPETGFVSYLSFLGINRYAFYHDLSFPVVVHIHDKHALGGKGYHFLFALEGNIRNNKPMNCSGTESSIFVPPSGSLICQPSQRCGNVTILVNDSMTGEPIVGAAILYGASDELCRSGVTELTMIDGSRQAAYTGGLPQCVGAGCTLMVSKFGYFTIPSQNAVLCGTQSLSCNDEDVLCDGETVQLEAVKLVQLNASLKKKAMVKDSPVGNTYSFNTNILNLLPSEEAVISLKKIKEHPDEETITASTVVSYDNPVSQIYPGLVPGEYELNINLMYKFPDFLGRSSLTFESVEECADGECVTMGPQEFTDVFIEGGARFNITVTAEDLMKGNVTFYALSWPDQQDFGNLNFKDLEVMGLVGRTSQEYRAHLYPRFGI